MTQDIQIKRNNDGSEFRRTFTFGKIAYYGSRRINAVDVEIALRFKTKTYQRTANGNGGSVYGDGGWTVDGERVETYLEFTAMGNIWNNIHSDCVSCGQNLDTIAHHTGALTDGATFRRILKLWDRWHLGGLHAGTREQAEIIEAAKVEARAAFEAAGYKLDGKRDQYGRKLDNEGNVIWGEAGMYWYNWLGFKGFYEWECDVLAKAGKLTVPFGPEQVDCGLANCWTHGIVRPPVPCPNPERGTYTFGHGWLIDPMPAEVLAEVYDLMRMGPEQNAERFDAWLKEEVKA